MAALSAAALSATTFAAAASAAAFSAAILAAAASTTAFSAAAIVAAALRSPPLKLAVCDKAKAESTFVLKEEAAAPYVASDARLEKSLSKETIFAPLPAAPAAVI